MQSKVLSQVKNDEEGSPKNHDAKMVSSQIDLPRISRLSVNEIFYHQADPVKLA